MKALLNLIILFCSISSFAQTPENQNSDPIKDHQIQSLIESIKELDDKDIEEVKKVINSKTQKKYDLKRSKKLAAILFSIKEIGGVRIQNCNDLDIIGDSPEVLALREELLDYCQQSLKGFWAELDADGILRFSYDMSQGNNSRTLNIGGNGDFKVRYRGNEILIQGNINDNEVGKTDSESTKRKINARIDYSINVALRNLEVFLMWHLDKEDAVTRKVDGLTSSGFERQMLSTGLRLEFIKKDFIDFNIGFGAGYSIRDAYGKTDSIYLANSSPSVIGTMDFTIRPTELLSLVSNGRVQRDFYANNPAWVAAQSLGLEFKYNGVTLGTRFTVDYDDYRSNAGIPSFGYTGMFTIGVNLVDLITDLEERAETKTALGREIKIWEDANNLLESEN